MEANAQLNARMSKKLKESGDAALALIGLSPTQAVRALWEKASRRGKDLEEVEALLCASRGREEQAERVRDDDLAESWSLVERTMAAHGVSCDGLKRPHDMPTDDELLEEALYERMVERGLM